MAGSGHVGRVAGRVAIALVLCLGLAASANAESTPAARYLVIANAGNRSLDRYFDRFEGPDRNHLARARSDLRHIAATERLFDRRLSRIAFSGRAERIARSLYRRNQKRAGLTAMAASSSSLHELRVFARRLDAANAPVERAVRALRRQLGLPPPPTS
ncbi:MAG TPA: hypothetical protein VN880_08535 [Solirubrobacteraceae bacterium]|jgi:hypothetical protein|nr:hypothetical protein [Solirubrobacteraceae bacterium]